MKKVLFYMTFVAIAFSTGCRTTDQSSGTSAVIPPDSSSDQIDPPGVCTADTNNFGFPSACDCPVNYLYDHTIGKCSTQNINHLDPTGVCTADTNNFGFPSACDCPANYTYNDTIGKCTLERVTQLNGVPSTKVTGFDFKGLKVLDSAPDNQICAAVVIAEEEACNNVDGVSFKADQCQVLCSQPIAKTGKVAGYNFKGRRVADALPAMRACPRVASAEGDACREVRGKSRYEKDCKVLCSKPIAKQGKVAGFDFSGFKIADKLPPRTACAQVATEETDACLAVGGETSYTKGCGILCSFPIVK